MPPPVPPPGQKTRPNYRGGWVSAERVMSGSLRLSRASTRTSLASDDLDKYMTSTNMDNFGGSLNNIENINPSTIGQNLIGVGSSAPKPLPLPPPRLNSSGSANNMKLFGGRSQDTVMSTVSFEMPNPMVPPPVKVNIKILTLNILIK
jgi:hypothetical protein